MVDFSLFRDVARAMSLGDGHRAAELIDKIPDGEDVEYHAYVTAVFSGFVGKYFEDDSSREAIQSFVTEMRYDYRQAQPPLPAPALENLLRAFFGEDHLMEEIDPVDQLSSQFMAMRKMVFQSAHLKDHLEDYLADAEALAIQWLKDD